MVNAVHIWKELVKKGCELGFMENAEDCPSVPELLIQADYVVNDVSDYFMSQSNMFSDYYSLMTVSSAWCAYMGMGAVVHWYKDKQALQLNGIMWAMTQPKGFEGVADYVTDLLGMNDEQSKELSSQIFRLWSFALGLAFQKELLRKEQSAQFTECLKAMYLYGMSFEMKRFNID